MCIWNVSQVMEDDGKMWRLFFWVLMWWAAVSFHWPLIIHWPQALTWRLNEIDTLNNKDDWMLCVLSMAFNAIDWGSLKRYGLQVCLWTASETHDVPSWRTENIEREYLFCSSRRGCDRENCDRTNYFFQLQLNKRIISLLLVYMETLHLDLFPKSQVLL